MKVSIIILNYNGRSFLKGLFDKFIDSVFRQRISKHEILEVIFADNNSRDDSVEYFLSRYGSRGNVKVVKFKRNHGFAKGINYAARYVNSRADLILILNPDVILHELYIETLANAFEGHPLLCCAQGIEIVHPGNVRSFGILIDDTLRLIELTSPTVSISSNQYYTYTSIIPVDAVIGAAMMIRKKMFSICLEGFLKSISCIMRK